MMSFPSYVGRIETIVRFPPHVASYGSMPNRSLLRGNPWLARPGVKLTFGSRYRLGTM
jgi:hypothetical protein